MPDLRETDSPEVDILVGGAPSPASLSLVATEKKDIDMSYAIETLDLTRTFKKGKKKNNSKQPELIMALDRVNLTINSGELFGVLGPNGAGKTTLIKILSTLLLPTSGIGLVDGIDVAKYPEKVRKKINMVSGGEHSGYGILTVRENLWMFSQLYGMQTKVALQRIDELTKLLGMQEYSRLKFQAFHRDEAKDEHHPRICV